MPLVFYPPIVAWASTGTGSAGTSCKSLLKTFGHIEDPLSLLLQWCSFSWAYKSITQRVDIFLHRALYAAVPYTTDVCVYATC